MVDEIAAEEAAKTVIDRYTTFDPEGPAGQVRPVVDGLVHSGDGSHLISKVGATGSDFWETMQGWATSPGSAEFMQWGAFGIALFCGWKFGGPLARSMALSSGKSLAIQTMGLVAAAGVINIFARDMALDDAVAGALECGAFGGALLMLLKGGGWLSTKLLQIPGIAGKGANFLAMTAFSLSLAFGVSNWVSQGGMQISQIDEAAFSGVADTFNLALSPFVDNEDNTITISQSLTPPNIP